MNTRGLNRRSHEEVDPASSPESPDSKVMKLPPNTTEGAAPSWFLAYMSGVTSKLSSLERIEDKLTATQTQVTELVQSIEFACAQARDATTAATAVQTEVSKLKSELNLLKCENNKLTNDLLIVRQGLTKQEAYSRRLNLKLDGLPEEPNESVEQTTRKVLHFFASNLQ